MDPSSPGDLQKLQEAIRHSQNELEPFRQQYRVPLADVLGNPLFDPAATERRAPSDGRNSEELRGDGVEDDSV